MGIRGKDLLSIHDLSSAEVAEIMDLTKTLKTKLQHGEEHHLLKGKTLGMIFQKSSTRTRVSFEVGMWQLGGTGLFLSSNDLQIGRGEPVKDTARVLSRYLDGIMIRTFSHEGVEELARYSSVPVINGLTDLMHPCQALTDIYTALECKGTLKGLKMAYIGDGNNMAHSLMHACAKVGMHIAVATPAEYAPNSKIFSEAQTEGRLTGATVSLVTDPFEAAKDADILYTDVWSSMGQEAEQMMRSRIFIDYQINSELLSVAHPEAIVMHCLPAHRGEEITDEVMESSHSVIFDQAENRLHVQKAILALLMGK